MSQTAQSFYFFTSARINLYRYWG